MAPLVALTAASMVLLGAGAASATDGPDPLGHVVDSVHKTVHKVSTATKAAKPAAQPAAQPAAKQVPPRSAAPSRNAPNPPASDSDSPGHETANPAAPDHGSSYIGHVVIGGNDLADVGNGSSTTKDDNSTTADSTLLAVGGTEIIGSHAGSNGPKEAHGPVPTIPLCQQTGGVACLDLLYSSSYATDAGGSSDARTDNGVAAACIGGTDPSGKTCNGALDTGVANGSSSSHRDQATGRTTAASGSSLADVCVQRDPVLGTCTVSADAVSSDGHADSNGTADRHSQVVNLDVAGRPAGLPADPFAVSVPTDCTSPSLVCVFGNQGETYLGSGLAGTSQSALDIFAVDRNLQVGLAHSETLAHNAGDANGNGNGNGGGGNSNGNGNGDNGNGAAVVSAPSVHDAAANSSTDASVSNTGAAANDGVLPHTGGIWSGLLDIGLLLAGAGAMALAWSRRRLWSH
ncbi:MAG: hypothetical protein ACR2FG_09890 [Marmoricola sp.]